jgi:hypothetical protein
VYCEFSSAHIRVFVIIIMTIIGAPPINAGSTVTGGGEPLLAIAGNPRPPPVLRRTFAAALSQFTGQNIGSLYRYTSLRTLLRFILGKTLLESDRLLLEIIRPAFAEDLEVVNFPARANPIKNFRCAWVRRAGSSFLSRFRASKLSSPSASR